MTNTNIVALETATSVLNVIGSYDNYSTLLGDFDGGAMEAIGTAGNVVATLMRLIDTILYKLMSFIREKRGVTKLSISRKKDSILKKAILDAKFDNENPDDEALVEWAAESSDSKDKIIVPVATYIGYLKQCEGELKQAKTTLKGLSVRKDSDANTEADKRKIRIYRKNISYINRLMSKIMGVINSAAFGKSSKGEASPAEKPAAKPAPKPASTGLALRGPSGLAKR